MRSQGAVVCLSCLTLLESAHPTGRKLQEPCWGSHQVCFIVYLNSHLGRLGQGRELFTNTGWVLGPEVCPLVPESSESPMQL